jgi:hypothetical protein
VRLVGFLVLVSLFVTACSSSGNSAASSAGVASVAESHRSSAVIPTEVVRRNIPLPLSLYVLTDADDPASALSSHRSIDDVETIAAGVQAIWQPAAVKFDPVHVESVAVPTEVLEAIARSGDAAQFFEQVGRTFDVPKPGLINGFFVATAAGVNGFNPVGSAVFFVVDEPSVHDERVSSHEVGHILGLRHAIADAERLMFSGTNGMALTEQEKEVARYGAEGMVDGTQ